MNNVLGISPPQWGGIFIAFSLGCLFLRTLQRTRAIAVFAGICLAGGIFVRLDVSLGRTLSHLTDQLFARLFGAGISGILALACLGLLAYDLHPRGGGASKRTFWIAALSAGLLVAGVSTFKVLNGIPADMRTGVSTVTGG
jgi:hypothetical protein